MRTFRPILRVAVRRVAYVVIGAVGLGYRVAHRGYPLGVLSGLKSSSTRMLGGSAGKSGVFGARPGAMNCATTDAVLRRILVVRVDLLGDVLLSMTAVRALRARYPEAHIAMLTLPYTAPLARLYPEVDEVFAVDTNRIRTFRGLLSPATWRTYLGVLYEVRSRHFDLAISLSGWMGSLCAFLSGSPRTIGYAQEAYPWLLTDPVPGGRYRERAHEVEYVLELVRAAGVDGAPDRLSVPVDMEAARSVDRLLASAGVTAESALVLIHPGAGNGTAKRWPADKWVRFARSIRSETGARIALVGARSDAELADSIARHTPGIMNFTGMTTVEQLIALVARADLLATGDSGPLHVAVALGTPLLAVYGPTDVEVYGPYNPSGPVRLHRTDLPCSPCYTAAAVAECPLGDPICMRLVTVESMVESAVELLGGRTGASPALRRKATSRLGEQAQ